MPDIFPMPTLIGLLLTIRLLGLLGAMPLDIEDCNSYMLLKDTGKPNYAAGIYIFLLFLFFFILNSRISISSCYLRYLKRIILI
jgi:hypothetical protein